MEFVIRADAPRIPHKKHWQFCVGSGHALLALRTDYVKQLRFIHDTLGIERVRFHGIFNDDMRTRTSLAELFPAPGAEAFTEENFRACGLAYDNVLEAGGGAHPERPGHVCGKQAFHAGDRHRDRKSVV